jgi:hypothetical protein
MRILQMINIKLFALTHLISAQRSIAMPTMELIAYGQGSAGCLKEMQLLG